MKIDFILGELEQHRMELTFDQTSGNLRMLMDGTQVLEDSPSLVREPVKTYELNIGEAEKHQLALQLGYGNEAAEDGVQAIPRLSLRVTPIEQEGVVQKSLGLDRRDNVFDARAAATSGVS